MTTSLVGSFPDTFLPDPEDLAAIRAYLQQQCAYGRDDFRAMVEAKTKRFASVRPAHRPAKSKSIIEAG